MISPDREQLTVKLSHCPGAVSGATPWSVMGQLCVGKWKLEPLAASVRGHREVTTLARV
jgi:hypothetical protein